MFPLRVLCYSFRNKHTVQKLIPADIQYVCQFQKHTNVTELPEKPKKPVVPFFKYVMKMRPEILKDNPSLSHKEIVKVAANLWKSVPEEYEDMRAVFEVENAKYRKDMIHYQASLTDEQKNIIKEIRSSKKETKAKRSLRKENRDNEKPKRAPSSFTLYLLSLKPTKTPDMSVTEFMRKCANSWKELGDMDKAVYKARADTLAKEYRKKLEEWELKMVSLGRSYLVRKKCNLTAKGDKVPKKSRMEKKKDRDAGNDDNV